MDRPEHSKIDFFVGREVEHTPAYNQPTLFVIGVRSAETVIKLAQDHHCSHIYFGANMSFPNPDVNNSTIWNKWEEMIKPCLANGFLCTLDIDVKCVEGLAESSLPEYNNFIPMISVKIPYAQLLGYNAVVKIDDKELFMFRFAVAATQRKCTIDALGRRDDEILGVLKSE